jgi:arylsulfatase A-like enzyme
MEGVSMACSFDDANAAERHETQYFEILGNRGIYHWGWSAVTKHRTPWQIVGEVGIAFDDDPGSCTTARATGLRPAIFRRRTRRSSRSCSGCS